MRIVVPAALAAALVIVGASPAGAASGSPKENKALVQGMMEEVFNRHDLSAPERVMAEGYIQHNPAVPQGRNGFRAYMQATFASVPDWHYQLRKISADGDLVWTYGTYGGTQQGDWGRIPATGRSFAMEAADIWRIEDGRIVEHWDVLDINGMMRQLGVLPPIDAPRAR